MNKVQPQVNQAIGLCLLLLCLGNQGFAQESPTKTESLAEKREILAQEMDSLWGSLAEADHLSEDQIAALTREVDILEQIDLVYAQLESQRQRIEELKLGRPRLEKERDRLRQSGPSEPERDTFSFLESVRIDLLREKARAAKVTAAQSVLEVTLENARDVLEARQRERRRIKELVETAPTNENKDDLRLAEHREGLAGELLNLRLAESETQSLTLEAQQLGIASLEEKLAWTRERVLFTAEDLQQQLDRVTSRNTKARASLDEAKGKLEGADQKLSKARMRLAGTETRPPLLLEEVETLRLVRESLQVQISLSLEQMQWLVMERSVWEKRYQHSARQMSGDATEQAQGELRQLQASSQRLSEELNALRKDLASRRQSLEGFTGQRRLRRWMQQQLDQLRSQTVLYESALLDLDTLRGLYEIFLSELETEPSSLLQTWSDLWDTLAAIWQFEITNIDDRPITVQKIVLGILLVLLGLLIARLLSGVFARRVLPRLGLTQAAVAAIRSVVFYVLLFSFTLLALRLVNVPLTVFTLLGGAAAIGLGFGSQNIVNNFISGLILLAERPIRIGDLIEVEDLYGTVEDIGARSTHVRSSENVDIIVPNSSFLEKNVINWTLSDDRYRAQISVGVAYGSPTEEVARLIRKAVEDHPRILKRPDPIILFADFGNNSLDFEVHFWIRMRRLMDRRIVASDLRYRVDEMFREAGIVIAFPQRDVHLDSSQPLDVRLLNES